MKPHERIKRIVGLDLTAPFKAVLHTLAYHCNPKDQCFLRMELIATESGMAIRQARRIIRKLEEIGHIKANKRIGRSSTYHLTLQPRSYETLQPRSPMTAPPVMYDRHNSSPNIGPNPQHPKIDWTNLEVPISPCSECGEYLAAFGGFGKCGHCMTDDKWERIKAEKQDKEIQRWIS